MKKKPEEPPKKVATYWKARLLVPSTDPKKRLVFWAYTQSLSLQEVRFQSEKYLHLGTKASLDIQAIHQGVKHPLHLTGKVLSSVLLACGTLYGIDLQITQMSPQDERFIQRYIKDKQNMKLTYSSF